MSDANEETVLSTKAAGFGDAEQPQSSQSSDTPPFPSVDSPDRRVFDDADSAVDGLRGMSSATSVTSSIYSHVEENGRTYHSFKSGKYMLPNDEQEQKRLNIQHAMYCITLGGKLHLAPIAPDVGNVLDIATGTGIWAIEFAEQYPSSQVLGTDLSAIQPLNAPRNCDFEIDDAEEEWVFNDKFNYIHGRNLLSCFKDPPSVFREAYKSLAPGGYFELQDMIFPFAFLGEPPRESPLFKWFETIVEGAARLGRPWTNVQYYKRWLEEIGFEDVVEKKYYWPLNAWAKGEYYKNISVYAQVDFLSALEGLSLKVMGSMGWSADEVRQFLEGVKRDTKDTNIHCYCPMIVVYGRKPLGPM